MEGSAEGRPSSGTTTAKCQAHLDNAIAPGRGEVPAPENQRALSSVIKSDLASFFPGYFALVMATGIVSIAAHFQGMNRIALGLFALNLVAYVVL